MLGTRIDIGLDASLDCYALDPAISTGRRKTRPALIICPGGGYLKHAAREGEPVAARFAGLGCSTFVLRYSTYVAAPPLPGEQYPQVRENARWPLQVAQLMRAMAYVRDHTEELDIDANSVYCLGFSAGAHVVCSLAELWDDNDLLREAGIDDADAVRPSGILLCYPMLSASFALALARNDSADPIMKKLELRALFGTEEPSDTQISRLDLTHRIRPDMPRCFIWHTAQDRMTPPAESLVFATGLLQAGVPCELHLFEQGDHGMSLCDETTAVDENTVDEAAATWVDAARRWIARGTHTPSAIAKSAAQHEEPPGHTLPGRLSLPYPSINPRRNRSISVVFNPQVSRNPVTPP